MDAADSSHEILIDQAMPGMVLAEAVLDKSGVRLISPDVALTEKSIDALRQRGVPSVRVLQSLNEEEHRQRREQQLQRLDVLFRNSLATEANRLLLEALRNYRMMS